MSKQRQGREMKSGATVIALRIGAAGLAYALVVVLARWLTAEDFGHYSMIISVMTITAFVARLGADIGVVRFLGLYRANGQADLAEGLVRTATRAVIGLSVTIGLIASVAAWFWPGLSDKPFPYIVSALLVFPAFTLTDVMSGVLRSYGENVSALAPKDIYWRVATVVVAGVVVLLALPEGTALTVLMAGSGISLMVLTFLQYRKQAALRLRRDGKITQIRTDIPAWTASAKHLLVGSFARNAARTFDVLLVGALLSVPLAGAYFAVSRTAELLGFMLSALNMIVGPTVARGTAEGRIEETQRKLSLLAVFLLATSAALMLAFIFFGRAILALMDPDFVQAYPALLILSLGQCVNVFVGSSGVVLNMTGHERVSARVQLITMPVSLILLAIFTPLFGLNGTALASTIGISIWNIWLWIEVLRLTPYDPSILGVRWLFRKGGRRTADDSTAGGERG